MTQIPPLNALRAFEAAGRSLNFRAAAEGLGVTQGAVAQQVRALETRLGMALFNRQPRGLAFTAAGRRYHAQVQEAFGILRDATESLLPERDRALISVTPTFAAKWLIPNLPDFAAEAANVDLRILATERVSSFHADGIDLAVRQGTPPFAASLRARLLFRQEIVAVASPALLNGRSLTRDTLKDLPRIHDTHPHWPQYLAHLGLEGGERRGLHLSQTALAIDAAIAGQGVALASRFLVEKDVRAGNLVECQADALHVTGDFYLLSRRDVAERPSVAAVIRWMTIRAGAGG